MKRILGYIFIFLAAIFLLTAIKNIITFLALAHSLLMLQAGTFKGDAYGFGRLIGTFIYWSFHIFAMIMLWRYGRKWTRKQSENPMQRRAPEAGDSDGVSRL
ncbi:hypothetical protein ACFQ21_10475 [Ohtaekwangia kribbensis]|jgi:hypothetical protein|uniref:Uncharacterized protein n=1 Tax=Ohtaekwangia kribbensis TaxID=688913 RepID=A0ABW3K3H0_9BACT